AAFKRAMADGADGIEFDVRLSKDDVPVVFHDKTLDRTARREGLVSDFTSAQLSSMDIGSWFNMTFRQTANSAFSNERISMLSETLIFLEGFTGRIYIELKCDDSDMEPLTDSVCAIVKNSPLAGQVVIKSFKLDAIRRTRIACPNLITAALFPVKLKMILRTERHILTAAHQFGADEISLHYSLATRKLMNMANKRGLPVTIWTVDNPRWIKRCIQLGVKAIITNNPARLLAKRSEILCGY
ncbi:MAG: glycerophosphodiester phosphodiesterase family protein, partial [Acidobacteriota bacterium]